MLYDLYKRFGAVAGSVVTLVTALAAGLTLFITEVTPQLPDGWQDDTVKWGGIAVTVLLSAAAAVRRVTEVPPASRGLLMPEGETLVVTSQHPDGGASSIETTR